MALCAGINSSGFVYASSAPAESCPSTSYVLLTNKDYELLKTGIVDYSKFTIHQDIYADITGYMLFAFVSGHILGRILKTMGRA